jgi:hypothetical protein
MLIPRWYMRMESHSGMILTGKTKELRVKSVSEPLCPPQIPQTDLGMNLGLHGEMLTTNHI